MKQFLISILVLTMSFVGWAEASAPAAQTVLDCFVNGEYDVVYEQMSEQARAAVSTDALEAAWTQINSQQGSLINVEFSQAEGYSAAIMVFENGLLQLTVGTNAEGEIETLLFQPLQPSAVVNDRERPENAEIRETKLFAGTGKELNAEIIAPEGCEVWAVLVHGSGPSDMDETIGSCMPFRDLAYDLAVKGVGTIRFDKMSLVHPEQTQTLADEYLTPVAEALRVLKTETGAEKVIAIGHSQGGMLMPWLVSECGFDGGVALAGTPKQLWEISYQQNLAIMETMTGDQLAAAQAQVEAEVQKAQSLDALENTDTVFGLPAGYLKEMAALDQIELAKSAGVPMLFMWGEKDFQVSRDDFEAWIDGLTGADAFTFIEYGNLNHLFMEAQEGDSIVNAAAVYDRGGQMDSSVAADIAEWLRECGLCAKCGFIK